MTESPWLSRLSEPPADGIRLFCFPYAGAGASAFYLWSRDLAPSIAVCAVQLPGRETRLAEVPVVSLKTIVDTVVREMRALLDCPFAFFGHSMGTVLAFETARKLRDLSLPLPAHLFVSGRGAPDLEKDLAMLHRLPDAEFIAECVRRYQGIPKAVLDEPELVNLFLPSLRADMQAVETYRYDLRDPLECPITALQGREDPSPPAALQAWARHTTAAFRYQELPGGHFFIHTARSQIMELIRRTLLCGPSSAQRNPPKGCPSWGPARSETPRDLE